MKKILLFLAAIIAFASCQDFLEETNRNQITADVLYSTPEGYDQLVNSCYAYLRTWFGKPVGFGLTEQGTDCYTNAGADSGRMPEMGLYNEDLNSSQQLFAYMWRCLYSGLNTCNAAIARADKAGLDEATKKQYLGEVHFLRALYLHLITEIWGDVILYTEEMNSPVSTAERTSQEKFYEQIFQDIETSISLLPADVVKNYGRVTQVAAKALKARLCLYRKDYANAAKLAQEVLTQSGATLYDSFKETFSVDNAVGQTNLEAIWWVDYSKTEELSYHFADQDIVDPARGKSLAGNYQPLVSAMSYWMVPNACVWVTKDTHAPWVHLMPTYAWLHTFDETIDQRYDGTFRTEWLVNDPVTEAKEEYFKTQFGRTEPLEQGDVSFTTVKYSVDDEYEKTCGYNIYDADDVYDPVTRKTIGTRDYFVSTYKFQDNSEGRTGWEYYSKRDFFVFRAAEMHLIIAEALMESNPTEAVKHMNILREARAIEGKEAEMRITASDLTIDFILDERGREFAGEQQRFFDLKRTGKLVERVKKMNPNAGENIKEYHAFRPIPQAELDALTNGKEFGQNEGYN